MLALAVLSRQSCDIKLRTIGHAVSQLFPKTQVLDATIQGTALYTSHVLIVLSIIVYEYFKKYT